MTSVGWCRNSNTSILTVNNEYEVTMKKVKMARDFWCVHHEILKSSTVDHSKQSNRK
jgi:hypothetical protein